MGAGSSNVQKIRIQNDEDPRRRADEKSSKKKSTEDKPNNIEKTSRSAVPERSISTSPSDQPDVTTLTQQLCESESLRLDLEDRIQYLEEQLAKQDTENLMKEEKPCDETLHAKDQYIVTLEKEKRELENENKKIKIRHKKKLKQLSGQMLEYKQETKFQMMELKEDIEKLKEENVRLKASQGNENASITSEVEDGPKLPGGEKMKLILDLSEQVTEQSDKIAKLERKLDDKDKIIGELRVKLKNSAGYITAVQEHESNVISHGNENKTYSSIGSSNSKTKQILVKGKDASENQSTVRSVCNESFESNSRSSREKKLFCLPEEDEEEEEKSEHMTKLSSMLQGVKVDSKRKSSRLDSPVDDVVDREKSMVEDDRTDSRSGRDSGLGSAGKAEKRSAKIPNISDWNSMESGSGLSDSDHESSSYRHSKISSAPAKLQNGGRNLRLKKKSSSLRKRATVKDEDKPPKPVMAFEEGEREEIDKLLKMLPPVMAPVDVTS